MVGHLVIEGSSTVRGVGDETGRFGFAGRLATHFLSDGPRPQEPEWVYVHTFAQLDRQLPTFAPDVADDVRRARAVTPTYPRGLGFVGIFGVGGVMDYAVARQGKDAVIATWQDSLAQLKEVCEREHIAPIFFGLPRIARMRNGNVPDAELRDKLEAYTVETARSLDAPYVTFETIVGDDLPHCFAPDGRHPNAAGHQKVFEYLLPLVTERFVAAAGHLAAVQDKT